MITAVTKYKWTNQAKDCYMRGCVCRGCPVYECYSKGSWTCQMKTAVLALVARYGIPKELEKSENQNFIGVNE